jgi:AhpD family alkylhydroperoxidase
MESAMRPLTPALFAILTLVGPALADDPRQATLDDIKATFGGVPTFVGAIATPALAGIWAEEKSLELGNTALDAKTKALISLAVAAQIPCSYCIYSDTLDARHAGATDDEIAEAVAMTGLTRNISTILNGMQVDLAQYKTEMGHN